MAKALEFLEVTAPNDNAADARWLVEIALHLFYPELVTTELPALHTRALIAIRRNLGLRP